MYVCMYVFMHICIYVCMHVCLYVCKYVCMHFGMYDSLYVCIYVLMPSHLLSMKTRWNISSFMQLKKISPTVIDLKLHFIIIYIAYWKCYARCLCEATCANLFISGNWPQEKD